jgi:uncharacterized repeat protein (TIGR03803 family)
MKLLKLSLCMAFATIYHFASATGPAIIALTYTGGINQGGTIIRYICGNNMLSGHYDLPSDNLIYGPYGATGHLIQASNGLMYGKTTSGGAYGVGSLFVYNYATDTFRVLASFDTIRSGTYPTGSLLQASNGKLYGLTSSGGSNGGGTLYSYTIGSDSVAVLQNLPAVADPPGALIQAANGKLYGMTFQDGTNSAGTIFEYNIDSAIYTIKYNLPAYANSSGALLQIGADTLFGLTIFDGFSSGGTLFRFVPASSTYDTLYNFNSGAAAQGSLIQASNGKLYGLLGDIGVTSSTGNLFSFDLTTRTYTDLYDCNDTTLGYLPIGSLFQASDSMLYGLMSSGGTGGGGTIFQYNINTSTYTKEVDLDNTTGYYPEFASFIEYHSWLGTGIQPIDNTMSTLRCYPSPTSGAFTIDMSGYSASEKEISICDQLGRIVYQAVSAQDMLQVTTKLSPGLYTVSVTQDTRRGYARVVVE